MSSPADQLILRPLQPSTQIGSDSLPCWSFPITDFKTVTKGDWDFSVREFTRIYYYAQAHQIPGNGGPLLDDDVRTHVRDQLLSISGPMGDHSYSWMQCGNQEQDAGTPQELADQRGFLNDVEDTAGDFLEWLLRRWSLILIAVPALTELKAFAGVYDFASEQFVTAAVVAAGAAAAAELRIPETENHLLQIESSRYLKNQIIIRELGDYPGVNDFRSDQKDIKAWLLQTLQGALKSDFSEYNARPYQYFTMSSVLNLADFAEDDD